MIEAVKITAQSLDKYERDLMRIFNCNPEWPVCLFDFSFKNKTPSFVTFKVEGNLESYVFEDYYFGFYDPISLQSS